MVAHGCGGVWKVDEIYGQQKDDLIPDAAEEGENVGGGLRQGREHEEEDAKQGREGGRANRL